MQKRKVKIRETKISCRELTINPGSEITVAVELVDGEGKTFDKFLHLSYYTQKYSGVKPKMTIIVKE